MENRVQLEIIVKHDCCNYAKTRVNEVAATSEVPKLPKPKRKSAINKTKVSEKVKVGGKVKVGKKRVRGRRTRNARIQRSLFIERTVDVNRYMNCGCEFWDYLFGSAK